MYGEEELASFDVDVLPKAKPKAKQDTERLLQVLKQLGEGAVGDDSIIFEGTKIVLPGHLKGPGGLKVARDVLKDFEEQQEQPFVHEKTFDYRPNDGAAAFHRAMKKVFGTAGIGKTWYDFFGGAHHPQLINVKTGVKDSMQVPWGTVQFPLLEATFEVGATRSRVKGVLSHISVVAKKKFQAEIEGLFRVIEDELRTGSIYRGKAITGAEDPGFWNEYAVDPAKVVYNDQVLHQFQADVWSVLDYDEEMRAQGIPLKRAFLLAGPWGTGKTIGGALTAQHATQAGWTFILVRPEDDPLQALRTAELYAPAVVWIEDADNLASKDKSRAQIIAVLDAMDNVANKGTEIMVGFTTNYPEVIEKGMLRPGRIDAVIGVGALDPDKVPQLMQAVIDPALLASDIDWAKVGKASEEYVPAFVVEAAHRAVRHTMARNNGRPTVITTFDLVNAAEGLRAQHDMMNDAKEAEDTDQFGTLLRGVVKDEVESVVRRTQVTDFDEPLVITEPTNGAVVSRN